MMHDWWFDTPYGGWAHWLLFIAMVALVLYPVGRILKRLGYSPFWSILSLVPVVNLVGLWILATVEWPQPNRR
jgi:hypothetical protein